MSSRITQLQVMVTGASTDIGLATARQCVADGSWQS